MVKDPTEFIEKEGIDVFFSPVVYATKVNHLLRGNWGTICVANRKMSDESDKKDLLLDENCDKRRLIELYDESTIITYTATSDGRIVYRIPMRHSDTPLRDDYRACDICSKRIDIALEIEQKQKQEKKEEKV